MATDLTTKLWDFIAEREGWRHGRVGYTAEDMMQFANEYVEEHMACEEQDYLRMYDVARIVVEHDDEMLVTSVRFVWSK